MEASPDVKISLGGPDLSHVVDRIHELIASRRLLDHPFYQSWSKGALTREALQKYAEQYYHWVHAFPTWLSGAHANATDLPMRQAILENLIDEERGPENHPELWLRFCDALGLDRDTVRKADLLPETRAAIAAMREIARDQPAVATIGAMYAYEAQQPEVMKTKREGLRDLYGVTSGHDYFEVHERMDVEHSAEERALIAKYADGCEDEIVASAKTALDATYVLLDGVTNKPGARDL
jgi:pyrroloquinoline-quinone synthase